MVRRNEINFLYLDILNFYKNCFIKFIYFSIITEKIIVEITEYQKTVKLINSSLKPI